MMSDLFIRNKNIYYIFIWMIDICCREDLFIDTYFFELVSTDNHLIEFSHIFQLPSSISDSEIVRIASLFSESTLKSVAMRYFDFTLAKLKNLRADNVLDAEQFNVELLSSIRNKFPERKVILYHGWETHSHTGLSVLKNFSHLRLFTERAH